MAGRRRRTLPLGSAQGAFWVGPRPSSVAWTRSRRRRGGPRSHPRQLPATFSSSRSGGNSRRSSWTSTSTGPCASSARCSLGAFGRHRQAGGRQPRGAAPLGPYHGEGQAGALAGCQAGPTLPPGPQGSKTAPGIPHGQEYCPGGRLQAHPALGGVAARHRVHRDERAGRGSPLQHLARAPSRSRPSAKERSSWRTRAGATTPRCQGRQQVEVATREAAPWLSPRLHPRRVGGGSALSGSSSRSQRSGPRRWRRSSPRPRGRRPEAQRTPRMRPRRELSRQDSRRRPVAPRPKRPRRSEPPGPRPPLAAHTLGQPHSGAAATPRGGLAPPTSSWQTRGSPATPVDQYPQADHSIAHRKDEWTRTLLQAPFGRLQEAVDIYAAGFRDSLEAAEVLAAHILPGAPPGSVPRAAQLGLSYIVGYKQADPQYLNECVCC